MLFLMIVMMSENRNANYKGSAFRKLSWEKNVWKEINVIHVRKYKPNELFI